MVDARLQQPWWIVDLWTVCRIESPRLERKHARQGREIVLKAAPTRNVNHHTAAEDDEVAREDAAAGLVPEGEVVGGMAGRMQHRQHFLAHENLVTLLSGDPWHGVSPFVARLQVLSEDRLGMASRDLEN